MAATDLRDELNCSICLNIYTDPVNLNCGHNYCKICIGNELDNQKECGIYSCPECRAEYREPSLCETHLKEILKYYCTTDAVCICVSCSLAGVHRGHQVETLNEAHELKKQRLRNAMDELKKLREEAEKEIQDLTKHEKEVKDKADRMKETVTVLIMDTRKQLEVLEKKVLLEISMQEEQVSVRISDRIQELEQKKSELSKEMGDIEELQNMTDPLAALQARDSFSTGCVISESFQTGLTDIITGLKRNHIIVEVSKKSLDVNTSPDILLDVDTASNELIVSSDLKTVSRTDTAQNRPEIPERFEFYPQVLSARGFTSHRHYWEVETSGDGWIIGMAYPSVDRKGGQSYSNYNAIDPHNYAGIQLCLYNNVYLVMCDGTVRRLNRRQSFWRIGIYLDYEVGELSFYELSNSHTHLHTFTARFTEPLHVAICVWANASVTIKN
uniref:Uncharacterized protein n=1 Tax=Leptobrachium leishanense TaxID=445787 RepID=A0A8C5R0J6_9ANUR